MAESNDDLKKAVEEVSTAFEAFKEANDANLKKHDAVLDGKIEKIQTALDRLEPASKQLFEKEQVARKVEFEKQEAARATEQAKFQEQLDRIETKTNRIPAIADPDADVVKAKQRRDGFFAMVRRGDQAMDPDVRKNVLVVSDDTGGGYLAPPDYVREIIKALLQYSPIRSVARVMTTSQKTVQIPKRTGVSAAVWLGEVDTRTENTGLAYGLEDTPVHELTCDIRFSLQMLEDSAFDMEVEMNMEMAQQFGIAEGIAFVSGSGLKKPEGITTSTATNSINSLLATDISADGIIDLKYSIKTVYAANATFLLNRKSLRSVRKLKDGLGQYLWMPGLAQGRPNTIDGDPYLECPDFSDPAASAKVMAYGDFMRGYIIIDRLQLSVMRDPYSLSANSQVKFLARKRVGGQVVLGEAISVMTCSASSN